MDLEALKAIAAALMAPGKGILAADESATTIKRRFDLIGVECTAESRRDYREIIFRSPAMADFISGVILYDETIWQEAADGTPLSSILGAAGVIPGIKVDEGTEALPNGNGDVITKGLDHLSRRLPKYHARGARFAKWRAVYEIGAGLPSHNAIHANAHALARYAALCQAHGIVPIVEPEILMDGGHSVEACQEVSAWALDEVFRELYFAGVALEGMILKPNMVVSGRKHGVRAGRAEVAERTLAVLRAHAPAAVAGVAFLSGGQSDEDATAHLDAMARLKTAPWPLTFSYSRALQAAPQRAWAGRPENAAAASAAFAHRARMNSLASLGQWSPELEAG